MLFPHNVATMAMPAASRFFVIPGLRAAQNPESGIRNPESDLILLFRKKAWFRSLPRAGYFPFGESNQSHCARA